MTELVCDFCSAPNPPWEYPAATTRMPLEVGTSLGAWCACNACRELIDAGDREGLAARCGGPPGMMRTAVEMVHATFFEAKRGEARPVRATPIHGRRFER